MNIKLIKTEKDYQKALKRLEIIFDARPGTKDGDELEVLGFIIEKYEEELFHFNRSNPFQAIKLRIEQMGYKQKDLAKIIGYKGRVSEILNRERKLTLVMIRNLHDKLNIPLESLIQAY